MRANGVVVDAPSFDDVARLGERGEHMLVQALVPQLVRWRIVANELSMKRVNA